MSMINWFNSFHGTGSSMVLLTKSLTNMLLTLTHHLVPQHASLRHKIKNKSPYNYFMWQKN